MFLGIPATRHACQHTSYYHNTGWTCAKKPVNNYRGCVPWCDYCIVLWDRCQQQSCMPLERPANPISPPYHMCWGGGRLSTLRKRAFHTLRVRPSRTAKRGQSPRSVKRAGTAMHMNVRSTQVWTCAPQSSSQSCWSGRTPDTLIGRPQLRGGNHLPWHVIVLFCGATNK